MCQILLTSRLPVRKPAEVTAAPAAPASPGDGWPLPGVALGCDYNPEQWPRQVWRDDVRLMQEAGITFVTLGVFSWALLEPEEGRFDLGWLDEVLDLLHGAGIAVDLATATASPPPWLSRAYPQTLPVDAAGVVLSPGSRQAWCPSSPVFAERALALVSEMGRRYGAHPAVVMWHVSNELGCHVARCYCDVSAAAFRRWLATRYGDIETMNTAWGTTFWSQHYGSFDEVLPPRRTPTWGNPTQLLDFARFSSDELLRYFCAERDLLRTLSDVPVTTNFMVNDHFVGADYWRWAREQDVVSQDHYLLGRADEPAQDLAFAADTTRGLATGRPWFLMEHSTSAVNWQPVNLAKLPGQLLGDSLSHVARGADAVGFFQWRASSVGAEKFHSGLVPHAGTDTKVWREVVELGDLLRRAAGVAGTRVQARCALVLDWQSWWAVDQGAHPSSLVRYIDQPLATHRALWRSNLTTDVVAPGADLAGYRVLVVPTLYLAPDGSQAWLRDFVESGGHVVVTYFSGVADSDDHVGLGGYPAAWRELLGLRTEEFFPLAPGQEVQLDDGGTGTVWTELTHLHGANAVASYLDGPVAGAPAVTRRSVGAGAAWYVGTALDDAALRRLLTRVCDEAGVEPVAVVPDGVEVVRRVGPDRSFLFVLNHTDDPAVVPVAGRDLVSGAEPTATLTVPSRGCALVHES
jgi:beta-galactosidase